LTIDSVVRFCLKYSKSRPSSAPFLSIDTFRKYCQLKIDRRSDLNKLPPRGQSLVVFCKTDYLYEFFSSAIVTKLGEFVLISGNSDKIIDDSYSNLIPPNMIVWFAQNLVANIRKAILIPIGLENLYHYNNGIVWNYVNIRSNLPTKRNRALYGFSIQTNYNARIIAANYSSASKICDLVPNGISNLNYRKLLSEYKFVVSPEGNGPDCHRTWEAMYLHTIPILLKTSMSSSFYSMGMPVLLVEDYEELVEYTEEKLYTIYEEAKLKFECAALWSPFWYTQITNSISKRDVDLV